MNDLFYPQTHQIGESETVVPYCSFLYDLRSGELLAGTPTATAFGSGASDQTITNVSRNTAIVTIEGVSHAVDQAVLFKVTGAKPKRRYRIRVTCTTDHALAPVRSRIVLAEGVDDGT